MKAKMCPRAFFAGVIAVVMLLSMIFRWQKGNLTLDDIHGFSNFLWIVGYGVMNMIVVRLLVEDMAKFWLLFFSFLIGCTVSLGFEYWIYWRKIVFVLEIFGCGGVMVLSPLLLYVFIADTSTSSEPNGASEQKKQDSPTYAHGAKIE